MHRHHEPRLDHAFHKGNEPLGQIAQDFARICLRRVDGREVEHALGRLDLIGALHRRTEQRFLRLGMPQERGRRHAQLGSDVGERGGREAFRRKDAAGAVQELFAADGRRAAHL